MFKTLSYENKQVEDLDSPKTDEDRPKKIDLCIASIIALHRAAFWRDEAPSETQLLVI